MKHCNWISACHEKIIKEGMKFYDDFIKNLKISMFILK
jgi:hypothetical protein